MTVCRPVARLKQPCAEEPNLDHLTANAVNLYPVANANSVPSHQHEPAAESQDEILKHDGQPSCGQTQNGGCLLRRAKDDEQHEQQSNQLRSKVQDRSKRLSL